MSDFGVTPEGFKRKRLDLLLTELNNAVQGVFGESIDLTPESPDGQINGVVSESQANLWEIAEDSYNAYDPNKASDASLSNLVQINGITRNPATFSTVSITLTGNEGTFIPAGSQVEHNVSKEKFATSVDATIPASGNINVSALAINSGPISADPNTLTVIVTPITGWLSADNSLAATLGKNEESDEELRVRRQNVISLSAQAIIDGLFSGIANIEDVTQVTVLENDTDAVDSNGLPPHSFQCIVVGGADEDIGNVIWQKKPAGITSFGTETVQILDSQGLPHDINFSRPTLIDIYVIVNLTKFSNYPVNGDEQIQQAIVDYANGDLVQGRGFALNQDVIFSELYTPVNTVVGHQIDSMFIGTSPSPTGTVNIPIGIMEISNFLTINIVVN